MTGAVEHRPRGRHGGLLRRRGGPHERDQAQRRDDDRIAVDRPADVTVTVLDNGQGGANPAGSGLDGLRVTACAHWRPLRGQSPSGWPDPHRGGAAMRVIICEDHALVRDGLERLLRPTASRSRPRSTTRRHSSPRSSGASGRVHTRCPLPPTFTDEGVRAAIEARREHPGLPVLILSQYVEQTFARECSAPVRAASGTCSRTGWRIRSSSSSRPARGRRRHGTRPRGRRALLGAGRDEGRLDSSPHASSRCSR